MSIETEFQSTIQNVQNAYNGLNNLGATIPQNKTIENIKSCLDEIYDNLPKTEYQEGTEVTIENGLKGKLDFDNGVVGIGQTEQAILPSEYQQVEYIESSGTEYLDTSHYVSDNNLKIQTKIYTSDMPTSEQDIASNQDETTGRFTLGLFNKVVFGYSRNGMGSEENVTSAQFNGANMLEIELDYNYSNNIKTLKVNNVTTSASYNLGISNSNATVKIFKSFNYFVGKMYYFRLYENNVLIMALYPCYRKSDNAIGMYDIVNNTFYTNSGAGTFTKGANAPTPNAEIPINSVTGNQDVVVSGINKLQQKLPTTTLNGITCTNNGDGSYTFSGTASANVNFRIDQSTTDGTDNLNTYKAPYTMVASIVTGTPIGSMFLGGYSDSESWSTPLCNIGTVRTITSNINNAFCYIRFETGNVVNETIYPMILDGEYTSSNIPNFEPYITPTSYQLSLGDIELNAIGNYKDELIYDVDEDKVYKNEKIGKFNVDSTSWQYIQVTQGSLFRSALVGTGIITNSTCVCTHYTCKTQQTRTNPCTYINVDNPIIDVIDSRYTDVNDFITWCRTNNVTWYIPLRNATLTELTDTTLKTQVKAWYNAHSNNGTTIITSNGNLPMIIKVRGLKGE